MTRALERLLRLQRGDLPRGLLLFAYLFLVIAAYLVGQVARDALFLGRFKASLLPFADLTLFLFVTAAVAALRPRGPAAGARPAARRQPHPLRRGGARPGRPGPRHPPPLALPRRLRLGRHLRRARARPGVDPRELRPHAPRGAPALRLRGGGSDPGRHGRGRPLERASPAASAPRACSSSCRPSCCSRPCPSAPSGGGGPRRRRRLRARRPASRPRAAGQPPAGARLRPPAGDRRDRGALLVRDRGRGLAVQGHGAAGARHARTPSPPSSARSTRRWACSAWRRRCS